MEERIFFRFSEILRELITSIFEETSPRIFSRSLAWAVVSLLVIRSMLMLRFASILSILSLYDSIRKVLISLMVFSLSFLSSSVSCLREVSSFSLFKSLVVVLVFVPRTINILPVETDSWEVSRLEAWTRVKIPIENPMDTIRTRAFKEKRTRKRMRE